LDGRGDYLSSEFVCRHLSALLPFPIIHGTAVGLSLGGRATTRGLLRVGVSPKMSL
jgi:hypothetical protein